METFLTVSSNAPRSAAGGQKKTPQREILDNIAKSDPNKAQQTEERLGALQGTIKQMQQGRQDQAAVRKEAARQKIARIKAQIQALKLSLAGNPKANARQLARLARELQQAVRDYSGAGGMGVTLGAATVPASAAAPQEGGETALAAAEEGASAAAATGGESASRASAEEDRAFAEEVRRLQRQIKQMIEAQKRQLAQEGKRGDNNIGRAEAALRDLERQLAGLENAAPSVDIEV